MKHKKTVQNLCLSAMFMAIGLILPLFTGQIPQVGNMMLPMHIPVLLCGLVCGWQYGLVVGFILPIFRYFIFGMPMLIPTGIAMAFELATYGGVVGYLYFHAKWQCVKSVYRCLITAMVTGRIVWGVVRVLMVAAGLMGMPGLVGQAFTWQAFMAGAFLNAIPGILIQLILIPTLMVAFHRAGLVPFRKGNKEKAVVPVQK